MTGRLDRSGASFPALGYGPLGPRLRRNSYATEIKSRPRLRSLWFPALGYGPLGPRLRRNSYATEIKSRPRLRSLLNGAEE